MVQPAADVPVVVDWVHSCSWHYFLMLSIPFNPVLWAAHIDAMFPVLAPPVMHMPIVPRLPRVGMLSHGDKTALYQFLFEAYSVRDHCASHLAQ